MWNNQYPGTPPSFPQADNGYNPGYYPPPNGPPPPPVPRGSYPGQQYHNQHPHPHHQQSYGGYAPPSGPPPQGYGGYQSAPPGPPPGQGYGSFAAPPGPPPMPPAHQQHYGPHFEDSQHRDVQPFFQYSQCNGKRKALCIGINYFGQDSELRGCINDARNMQQFLCSNYGYKSEDIVMLTDDAQDWRRMPTRQNMLDAMSWLVRDAAPNDSLFFHYSGHGGRAKDEDGDEDDGYDEVIYPVDHKESGHIVDDLMHEIMVRPLPPGCRLTAIYDSCHSGTALDLPWVYSTEGKLKEPNLAAEAGQGLLSAVSSYARGDMGGVFNSAKGLFKTVTGSNKQATEVTRRTKTSPADVIQWSGCKDSQTSADTQEAGQATGAMSYAFMTVIRQNPQQSYQSLLVNIREILKSKYSQKPQLSSSHPIDTNLMFVM
ncbi:hypothetical protein K435DRAFT_772718 [Dendrothele bispora CBS 962.96]|uniref:Peptidase C14 caspase domain-containing protein n=1 Tax=Dendrothele bispora (strain CBS 962.96) TaxID=1314807 RepID=A0A4S8MWI3_DENBC|nr:hypothetical protein K435DRAFT_772718 [Dendrothele bispora CBS 962.96]